MPEHAQAVRRLVESVLGGALPDDDVDLIGTGLLDSLSLVTLVVELEQEFGVELPFADLDLDDFRTVDALLRLVCPAGQVA